MQPTGNCAPRPRGLSNSSVHGSSMPSEPSPEPSPLPSIQLDAKSVRSTFASGSSRRNSLSIALMRIPRTVRRAACVIKSCRLARVMPTKQRRRSSSISSSPSRARMCGSRPSSQPIMVTISNSRPLAACSVIKVTDPASESYASESATNATDCRNPCSARNNVGGAPAGSSGNSKSPAALTVSSRLRRRCSWSSPSVPSAKSRRPLSSSTISTNAASASGSPSSITCRQRASMDANSSILRAVRSATPASRAKRSAASMGICCTAAMRSMRVSDESPMPRVGTFTMRPHATSSAAFATKRRYAIKSLTSLRS